jgi:hypothetical protein
MIRAPAIHKVSVHISSSAEKKQPGNLADVVSKKNVLCNNVRAVRCEEEAGQEVSMERTKLLQEIKMHRFEEAYQVGAVVA